MKTPLIEINDFSGGMSLNEKMGKANQFPIGNQLDFSSKPGFLTCGYSWFENLTGDSVEMPCEFPFIVQTAKGYDYYFGGDNTIIYTITAGQIALAHDDTNAGGIKGMIEYKGYLIWAGDTTLGRFDLVSGWDDSWQTGLTNPDETVADYHPMIVSGDGILYIAHGRYIASWDGTTFKKQALDLGDEWVVNCLANFGYRYLAIGATYYLQGKAPVKAKIFLWDRTSTTEWQDEIAIPENEMRAMIFKSGYLWIWAGESSNIYEVSEDSRRPVKMWSFVREDSRYKLIVYPGAVTVRRGTIFFGLSDQASTPSGAHPQNPTGIYSFPANPNKFSLNIPYLHGIGFGYNERYKGGATMYNIGESDRLFFSHYFYQLTDKYRLIAEATRANDIPYQKEGTYESFRYEAPINKKMFTEAFGVEFQSSLAGSVDLYYKKDDDAAWTPIFENLNTATVVEKIVSKRIPAQSLKLKLTVNGSSSAHTYTRPFIKRIFVTGHYINRIY